MAIQTNACNYIVQLHVHTSMLLLIPIVCLVRSDLFRSAYKPLILEGMWNGFKRFGRKGRRERGNSIQRLMLCTNYPSPISISWSTVITTCFPDIFEVSSDDEGESCRMTTPARGCLNVPKSYVDISSNSLNLERR